MVRTYTHSSRSVTINTDLYADADVTFITPSTATSTDLPASTGDSPLTKQLSDSADEQVYKHKGNHNYYGYFT